MGNIRENDAADMVKWLMKQQEQELRWAIYIEFEGIDNNLSRLFWISPTQLEHEVQHQRLSEYRNALPTRGLSSIHSVFFDPVQDAIKKYLTLESASLPDAHEYTDRYLEDEYDTLQASLENLMNMVNHENILEIWRVSLFNQYSTDNVEFDENKEMNQLISICGPNTYQASVHTSITQKQEYAYGFGVAKSGLKFALENKLVDEFVKLIERFIGNHTGVDVNNRMTIDVTRIENPKRLKHKGCSKMQKSSENVQDLTARNLNERQNLNVQQDKSRRMVETDTEDKEFEESSREQD
ncbi:3468_t:CDS:2, partial [Cetraspora pellucida]